MPWKYSSCDSGVVGTRRLGPLSCENDRERLGGVESQPPPSTRWVSFVSPNPEGTRRGGLSEVYFWVLYFEEQGGQREGRARPCGCHTANQGCLNWLLVRNLGTPPHQTPTPRQRLRFMQALTPAWWLLPVFPGTRRGQEGSGGGRGGLGGCGRDPDCIMDVA